MILFLNKMDKMQEELTDLREFIRLCKPFIDQPYMDTDIQKHISGPRFNLHMDKTVQPTKPAPTKPTPAFTSVVASSGKALGQTSNAVNQAAHTELSIESNRGDQNLSQPSVRAHWASQMSYR